jgi:hypothetical protein
MSTWQRPTGPGRYTSAIKADSTVKVIIQQSLQCHITITLHKQILSSSFHFSQIKHHKIAEDHMNLQEHSWKFIIFNLQKSTQLFRIITQKTSQSFVPSFKNVQQVLEINIIKIRHHWTLILQISRNSLDTTRIRTTVSKNPRKGFVTSLNNTITAIFESEQVVERRIRARIQSNRKK